MLCISKSMLWCSYDANKYHNTWKHNVNKYISFYILNQKVMLIYCDNFG